MFCIDVRSEGMRRHLEAVGEHQTLGFAGFFALPVHHTPLGGREGTDQCPVLLKPSNRVGEAARPGHEERARRYVEGRRRLHTATELVHDVKDNVATPFTFAEVAGAFLGVGMVLRTALPRAWARLRTGVRARVAPPVPSTVDSDGTLGFTADEQVYFLEAALRMMGLTANFGRLVLLCAHGSTTENNPYESAFDCGACGGNRGGVNARVFATMLNKPAVRRGLAERGIVVPADTHFLAGEHDTAVDEVRLFDTDVVPGSHADDLRVLRGDLAEAGRRLSAERCRRLPAAPAAARHDPVAAARHVRTRSGDWAQVRPEWGLAGNAAFVVGPRTLTEGVDLGCRTFLHSYSWSEDPDGAALEVILTAPLVVAEWINMQYYFSTVDNTAFGAGTKTVHNVVGRVGVLSGHRGDLQVGLP